MILKKIKLLALCLVLTANITIDAISQGKLVAGVVIGVFGLAACCDAYESSEYAYIQRSAQVFVENDHDFIKISSWVIRDANFHCQLIETINTANLEKSANAVEAHICLHSEYFSELINTTDLKIILQRTNNLLAYKPQNINSLPLAQTHENLLQFKANLEKLLGWLTPARIKLYKSSYSIINDYQKHDKSGNFNNHDLIKFVIHNSFKTNDLDVLIYDFNYITQVKQLRNKIQADLGQFLKASKWHVTPKSIENILVTLDSLYNDIAKDLVKTNHEI